MRPGRRCRASGLTRPAAFQLRARPPALVESELVVVGARVNFLNVEDFVDVLLRFGKLDAGTAVDPAVYVRLPSVVGRQAEADVVVLADKPAEVERSVPDVDLGVVEVVDLEAGAAGVQRDAPRGVREKLHEADGTRVRLGVRVELALPVDHGRDERGVEIVVAGVPGDDV